MIIYSSEVDLYFIFVLSRILLILTNDNNAEMTFTLSFQEKFPTDNFDPKKPHVELVESIDPSKVFNDKMLMFRCLLISQTFCHI